MAVGAYTMALLMNHTQTNFILELAAAAGVAAAAGLVIGLPATRLKGPYLAGMTLLFALAVPSIADKWPATFGGDQGLTTTVPDGTGLAERRGVAGRDPDRRGPGRDGAGGQPAVEPVRPRLPGRPRRRDRGVADGHPRRPHQGDGLRHQRRLRRPRRRAARTLDRRGQHRRVPAHPLDPVAGRHGARRHGHADRHGLGRHPARVPAAVVDVAVVATSTWAAGRTPTWPRSSSASC